MIPLPEIHHDEWFDNPLDSMPIAIDPDQDPIDTSPSEIQPPGVDQEETIHEEMYKIATSKYNPFSIGGSESIHDFERGSKNV